MHLGDLAIQFLLSFRQQPPVGLIIVICPSLTLLTSGFTVYFLCLRAVALLSL